MAHISIANKKIFTLDSNVADLSHIEIALTEQNVKLEETLLSSQKILQQSKILNVYKAHENDFTVDPTIFDTGDNV